MLKHKPRTAQSSSNSISSQITNHKTNEPIEQGTEAPPLQQITPARQILAPGIWGNHSGDELCQII